MAIIFIIQAVWIACCYHHSGASVSLYAYSSINDKEINGLDVPVNVDCNSSFSLACEIKPYNDSAFWKIDDSIAAYCFKNVCQTITPFPPNHDFSLNITTGDFIMTVSHVTIAMNGITYKCDDSETALSMKALVKAFPNNDTVKIDASAGKILVTTGCVYPSKETDIRFDLFLSEKKMPPVKYDTLSKRNANLTVLNCAVSSCPGLQTANFNYDVEFDEYEEGISYYICVEVVHIDAPNYVAISCSDVKFIVRQNVCSVKRKIVMPVLGLLDCTLFLSLLMAICFNCQQKQIIEKKRYLHLTCSFVTLSAVPISISFIIFVNCFPSCYDDPWPLCKQFKWSDWICLTWLTCRAVFGIAGVVIICYKKFKKDCLSIVMTIRITEFVTILFYIPPVLNIIITLMCWIRLSCKFYLTPCKKERTQSAEESSVAKDHQEIEFHMNSNDRVNDLPEYITNCPHPDEHKRPRSQTLEQHRSQTHILSQGTKAHEPGRVNKQSEDIKTFPHPDEHKNNGSKSSEKDNDQTHNILSNATKAHKKDKTSNSRKR